MELTTPEKAKSPIQRPASQTAGLPAPPLLWQKLVESHLLPTAHSVDPAGSDTVHTHVKSMLVPPPPKLETTILPSDVVVGEEVIVMTSS